MKRFEVLGKMLCSSVEEIITLDTLCTIPYIKIKGKDNVGNIVIMDKSQYIPMCYRILNNQA